MSLPDASMVYALLDLPLSLACVNVKIIDTTITGAFPLGMFAQPKISGKELIESCYSFYIEHPTLGRRVLFDLGMRKDYTNLPPNFVAMLKQGGWIVEIKQNVAEIIRAHGLEPESIDTIIWSHAHSDHTGDPSTFPTTTELVVGPGFSKRFLPGFPTNPEGGILETDYKDRSLREIDFGTNASSTYLEIGGFPALDYFGDGSFYLLDTPGHEIGHMCGLARTTPNSFIFMGADACHHPGLIRPTERVPLPSEVSPNPLDYSSSTPCPCAIFVDIHPNKSSTEPYYKIALKPDGTAMMFHNTPEAYATLDKVKVFDADDRVFVALCHDHSLRGSIDIFPLSANDWKEKGWKDITRWKFLANFEFS